MSVPITEEMSARRQRLWALRDELARREKEQLDRMPTEAIREELKQLEDVAKKDGTL